MSEIVKDSNANINFNNYTKRDISTAAKLLKY